MANKISKNMGIVNRFKGEGFLAKIQSEMSVFKDSEKRAKRYVARCVSWLSASERESTRASAALGDEYIQELGQILIRYAARDAVIGDEVIIYGTPNNKSKYTVIETVKYTLRLLQGVSGFVVHRPIMVLNHDKFHVKLDTLQADKMQILFEPNLEKSRAVTEDNLRAVLVPYDIRGVTGTVIVFKETIKEAKQASKNSSKSESPWNHWYESMVNKTAWRQALKVMPIPVDIMEEIEKSETIEASGTYVDEGGEIHKAENKTEADKASKPAAKKPAEKKKPAAAATPPPREEEEEEGDDGDDGDGKDEEAAAAASDDGDGSEKEGGENSDDVTGW